MFDIEHFWRQMRRVGEALNITHNCVVTDLPEAKPSDTSWRQDNSEIIPFVEKMWRDAAAAEASSEGSCICPLCGHDSKPPSSKQP